MKDLKLCGALLVVALAPACGGDDIFGTKCPSSGPALTSGTVTYTTVASAIADTCNTPPLAASELAGDYKITTESSSSCGVTLVGPNGGTFGQGMATSSSFQTNYSVVVSEASLNPPGDCQYMRTIASNVVITDDKTVTIQYAESQGNFMSLPGKNCIPPTGGSCGLSYTLTMTKK